MEEADANRAQKSRKITQKSRLNNRKNQRKSQNNRRIRETKWQL
ncbi:hypothetical protein CGSMWGv00703C2mash_00450 [Gardnerella pickettii 00703C2mash]|nr:hypothetical protein CGSMWGv00703C2mash_00450 [Gardnerella pickettii 00703C2mash]